MEKFISEGECVYCLETHKQATMSRHLAKHLLAIPATKSKSFHLNISAAEMFLHILIDGSFQLIDLDDFLRAIWLECCGHMSSFEIKGKQYHVDWSDMNADMGEKKSKKVASVFQKDMILKYQYDFGSTTELTIKVMQEYPIATSEGIKLLSRNNALQILCHVCGEKPAAKICMECIYEGQGMLCKTCATKHKKTCDYFEDMSMPVVNSPRMGVCAYDGGTIDTKRDKAWKG
jgi:Plasmid pRiA4b ORF-3-like protein